MGSWSEPALPGVPAISGDYREDDTYNRQRAGCPEALSSGLDPTQQDLNTSTPHAKGGHLMDETRIFELGHLQLDVVKAARALVADWDANRPTHGGALRLAVAALPPDTGLSAEVTPRTGHLAGKIQTVEDLVQAYVHGALDAETDKLILDNDNVTLYKGDETVFEMHPEELLRALLDDAGLPWDSP